jgi:hypothetical protein
VNQRLSTSNMYPRRGSRSMSRTRRNDLTLVIPALTLDVGRTSGRATLNIPATVTVGQRRSRISTLQGGTAFDGRALKLTAVTLRSDEASPAD